ncbi:hypothetical protein LFER_919 [Limosilactobacillus fermentum]|nr:hypothetical protein LFER_919 [Limosilactobacillus fermentum]
MNEHRSTTGRPVISLPHQEGDVGDFLKDFACTAVMAQPLLAQLVRLSTGPTQLGLAILDNLVKYTAPAFIFGILYTTIRTHSGAGIFNYRHYLRQQWAALFWPTIYWTSAYLLLLPKLQQEQHYHNWTSFAWRFVNGNAAPHLWYNTMTLQFIILMPCFWALHRLVGKRPQRGWVVDRYRLNYASLVGFVPTPSGPEPRPLVFARSSLGELFNLCGGRDIIS